MTTDSSNEQQKQKEKQKEKEKEKQKQKQEQEQEQEQHETYSLADQERIDQIDSSSAPEHTASHLQQSGKKRDRKEALESNCEGHQEDQHHTESHIHGEKTFDVPTSEEKMDSTFTDSQPKDESTSSSMDPKKEDKGVSGLANMRNTCYMNSAIQALRHNTEISAFFLENRHNQWIDRKPNSPKVELVRAYSDLLHSLWSASKPAYVRPSGFIQSMIPAAVAAGFDQFQVPLQHDSHEFLTFLLDQLHEGMAEEVNIEINRPKPITEQDKVIQKALEAWKRIFGKQYSPFTEMIYGLFRITMTCQNCRHVSDTWEQFNCLKLPFPANLDKPPTLQEMLREEFHEETIEGYACEKCSPTRTTAVRKTYLWRLPRMIVLSLKRFTPDGRKLYTNFTMASEETVVFKEFFAPESPEPSQHQPYELFATVDHHGSSGGGHYTAQAKSPLTEKWHLFDDETASSMNEPQLGISSYILFLKPSSRAAEA